MYNFQLQIGIESEYLVDTTVSLGELVNTLVFYNLEFVAKDYCVYFIEHHLSLWFKTIKEYHTINHMGAISVYIKYVGSN